MSYVVLARKWRPMRFEDLVGQDHVARTLGNAIDAGRVAHAFLFTGVRGVGKTTSARILAKALNCMREPGTVEPGSPDPGPTVTPCLKCSACKEITDGRDVDVQEIDGASYNGVDEVRKLQDSLPYRPNRDRFKIVIVDEVHMLTTAAWNAFLKTLEEPPPHVKFIFATTEVHKVPITILSRVQRFDFKMIPTRLIVERLRYVLEQEGSRADEIALGILARQAAGSMRDAMSLLDQVIAFGGEELTGEEVARVLGVASRKALMDIARAIVAGEPETCLRLVGSLADQGFDIPHVTRDIHALLRDLVVAKVCKDPKELLDLADEELGDVVQISGSATESDLMRLHQAFSKGYDDVMRGGDPRAGLEMLLVRLAQRPALLPIDELLHRIGNLEKRLTQAGAQARPRGGSGPGPSGGAQPPPAQRPRNRTPSDRPPASPSAAKSDDDVPDAHSSTFRGPAHEEGTVEARGTIEAKSTVEARGTVEVQRPTDAHTPGTASEVSSLKGEVPVVTRRAETVAAAESAAAPTPLETHTPTAEESALLSRMAKITDKLREEDMELSAYLEQTVPLKADGKVLELGLEKGHMFERQLTSDQAIASFERVLKAVWGTEAELKLTRNCAEALPDRTLAAERARERRRLHAAAIEEVKKHPRVQEAVQIFGAQIINVTFPDQAR